MRITMKTLDAHPDGALRPGQTYDVDPERAGALIAGGFAVPVDDPKGARPRDRSEEQTPPPDKPLDKMTVEGLKAHAAGHGIDLGDATRKADVLELVLAAEAARAAEGGS